MFNVHSLFHILKDFKEGFINWKHMTSADTHTALGLQDNKMTFKSKNINSNVDNCIFVFVGQANLDDFGVGRHTECDSTSKRQPEHCHTVTLYLWMILQDLVCFLQDQCIYMHVHKF